jgi:hypothetical protein
MSDCSVSAKIAGVIFTKGIQEETLCTLNAEVLVRKLESTLKGTGFDPLTMAHVIQGAMLMSLPTARKMVNLKNTADIEAFVAKKTVRKILKLLLHVWLFFLLWRDTLTSMTSILHLQI